MQSSTDKKQKDAFMTKLEKLYLDLSMLGVFRSLLDSSPIRHFSAYSLADTLPLKLNHYAAMVAEIYREGGSLTDSLRRALFEDENVYIINRAIGKEIPDHIREAAIHELSVLSCFASLTPEEFGDDLKSSYGDIGYLPKFASEECDLNTEYEERISKVSKYGYGIFSTHHMFRLDENGEITPILSSDNITLDSFVGYEDEREAVIQNTVAFLSSKPAMNLLLYGDAGTGKSSTVKAIVNRFYSDGLRLIEIRKDQLTFLPYIMGRIKTNPLRFIIFIDDLSFYADDDQFSMLKAALEGSASAKADNALIYATSNRRHLVKESFGDREGGEVHRNDAMQEKLSLSERFGLTVYFGKPNKKLYLEIVHRLAEDYGIDMDSATLEIKAEEFALRRGNRSPRCAEQFIKSLL